MLADREGRLEYRPKRWKGELFPYENTDTQALFSELEAVGGLVVKYEVNGSHYVWIPHFLSHQKPHQNESASTIPPYTCDHGAKDLLPRGEAGATKDESTPAESLFSDSLNADSGLLETISASQPDGAKKKRPVKTPAVYSQDFEAFWAAYPARNGQKTKKAKAWEAFWKITTNTGIASEYLIERIKALAPQYGEFPRDAVTWLNQRGWEDEVAPIRLQPRKQPQNKAQALQDQNIAAMNEWLASKGVQG